MDRPDSLPGCVSLASWWYNWPPRAPSRGGFSLRPASRRYPHSRNGDLSGTDNPAPIAITGTTFVTATFTMSAPDWTLAIRS